jgi:hypothetical protein
MKSCDYQEWRETKYWTEGCDMIFHKKYGFQYHKIVKQLFKDIKGIKVLPGEHHYICNEEFIHLTKDAGLHNDHFGEREAQLAYCLAQETIVDELHRLPDCLEHFKMDLIEFYEALGRIADIISPPQPGKENELVNFSYF